MINVIFNDFDYEITQKKMEIFDKYNKVIQWGRRNPVKFMELYFGLEFTDHQKYILLSTWTTTTSVWLMSRNSGKSYLSAPYMMARSILIPNHHTYIMCPAGNQAQETFGKLEDLAKGEKIYSSPKEKSYYMSDFIRDELSKLDINISDKKI